MPVFYERRFFVACREKPAVIDRRYSGQTFLAFAPKFDKANWVADTRGWLT